MKRIKAALVVTLLCVFIMGFDDPSHVIVPVIKDTNGVLNYWFEPSLWTVGNSQCYYYAVKRLGSASYLNQPLID